MPSLRSYRRYIVACAALGTAALLAPRAPTPVEVPPASPPVSAFASVPAPAAAVATTTPVAPSPTPAEPPARVAPLSPPPVPDDNMVSIRHRGGHMTKHANAAARWSRLRATSSCWYFSGPSPLGRDHDHGESARLVENGGNVELTFGTATFRGHVGKSGAVVLRHAGADRGERWRYVETLKGRLQDGVLTARYAYRECSFGGKQSCQLGSGPSDFCQITAKVQVKVDVNAQGR